MNLEDCYWYGRFFKDLSRTLTGSLGIPKYPYRILKDSVETLGDPQASYRIQWQSP